MIVYRTYKLSPLSPALRYSGNLLYYRIAGGVGGVVLIRRDKDFLVLTKSVGFGNSRDHTLYGYIPAMNMVN